jgi:hypothetical protein
MANEFDFASLGNIFGGMPGATPTGLDALLTEDQRKLLGRNAALSAAGALLQASGRSAVPISMGQALGSALQAGQQGYQQARASSFQDLLLGEKIKEMQREAVGNEAWQKYLKGEGQPTALTPSQAALAAPVSAAGKVGPTMARAELAAQMPAPMAISTDPLSFLNPVQRALIGGMPRKEGMPEVLKAAAAQAEFGKPEPVVMNGKTVMLQYNKLGQSRVAEGATPYEAQSPDIRAVEYLQGGPLAGTGTAGIEKVGQYRKQIATQVNVNPEQKGFENEMKLAGAFKQEPVYKDYQDVKSAFGQVVSSLSQGTPIGDVAGATKVMKLLDPGSVVRESELGIAMAASGRMDRLQNYFSNMMSGRKLTPTQIDDFKALSNELYSAAGQAYNQKRKEYQGFGEAYNFKNLDAALGAPATIPSLMRTRPGVSGGATRPSLGNIFGTPGG